MARCDLADSIAHVCRYLRNDFEALDVPSNSPAIVEANYVEWDVEGSRDLSDIPPISEKDMGSSFWASFIAIRDKGLKYSVEFPTMAADFF